MSVSNKRSWDVNRFVETLNYFGEIPFVGSFRWLQRLMGQETAYTGIDMSAVKKEVVVFSSKISSDSRKIASTESDWSALDRLCQPKSWQNLFENQLRSQLSDPARFVFRSFACETTSSEEIAKLVSASSIAIVLGTSTLSTVLSAGKTILSESPDYIKYPVFDFSRSSERSAAWGTLDDVVMGGVSQSGLSLIGQEQAVFSGEVSTENSGGFASVRTKNFEPPFNFLGWEGMRLRVRGDGQRYKFILRNSQKWDSPAYIYSFDTQPDTWLSVDVPFSDMVPTFRAKSMPNTPALDPAQIHSFQMMLSKFEYDRQLNPCFRPGPFSLELSSISAYRQQPMSWIIAAEASASDENWKSRLAELGANYRWIALDSADLDALTATALAHRVASLMQSMET